MPGRHPKKKGEKGRISAQHLMDVAIELFSERGYNSVTIHDITQQANVTHSLVYYHFKNKGELFNQAVSNLIDREIRQFQLNLEQHTDPIELLEDWFQFNIDHSETLMKLVRIMFDCSGSQSEDMLASKPIQHFYEQEHKILSKNISLGVKNKQFKNIDPEGMAMFISTHIDGIFYGAWTQNSFDIEVEMNRMKRFLWETLLLGHNRLS